MLTVGLMVVAVWFEVGGWFNGLGKLERGRWRLQDSAPGRAGVKDT